MLRGFCPIGTNVLHGSRTHLAGDERQVLQPVPAVRHTQLHQRVPLHAATHTQHHLFIVGLHHIHALNGRLQHHSGIVVQEQQVASAPYMKERKGMRLCLPPCDGIGQFLFVAIAHEKTRLGMDAEGVIMHQVIVFLVTIHKRSI